MGLVKLIATDLDGTLLDSSGKIPQRNLETIREAMRRGVKMTISTGRMFTSAVRFAAQLGIKIPLICYNGAMLKSPDGELFWHQTLDMRMAKKLLSIYKERGIHVQSYIEDVLYISEPDTQSFQDYSKHFGVTGKAIGDDLFNPSAPPTKLLAITADGDEAEVLAADLRERFGDELYVTRSNSNFVETMNPKANKANGLSKLSEILGVGHGEILAVGDGENDIEMVSLAGVGVAMSNGAKGIIEAAKYVAPSNDENGVSWAVERFVLQARETAASRQTT